MGSGSKKIITKGLEIRPELLGSKITTKKLQTPIILDGSEYCLQICKNLELDVFTKQSKQAEGDNSAEKNQQA